MNRQIKIWAGVGMWALAQSVGTGAIAAELTSSTPTNSSGEWAGQEYLLAGGEGGAGPSTMPVPAIPSIQGDEGGEGPSTTPVPAIPQSIQGGEGGEGGEGTSTTPVPAIPQSIQGGEGGEGASTTPVPALPVPTRVFIPGGSAPAQVPPVSPQSPEGGEGGEGS